QFLKSYENDKRPVCRTEQSQLHRQRRIVGGRSAEPDDFGYMVSLRKFLTGYVSPFPFCGGVMITDVHVLTAAHCLNDKTESMLSANVADYNFSSTSDRQNVIRNVSKLLQHEHYDKPSYKNDVALVTLSEPIEMQGTSFLAAILPPVNSDVTPGTTATVAGWGRLKYGGAKPDTLRQVDLPVVNRTECQKPLTHLVYDVMICAGGVEGQDACIGDSGGPLLVQAGNYKVVAGVVSFGKSCALKDVYGIYTRMGFYGPWVYSNTLNAGCKPAFNTDEDYPDAVSETTSQPKQPEVISDNNI
ncbi:unnamed protein product, partial [Ixodes pacificus]